MMKGPMRFPSRYTAARPQPTENCRELKLQLQAIDFSMVDTLLYLDAYPDDTRALEYFRRLNGEREELVTAMENAGCPPLRATEGTAKGFRWNEGPWPWEPDAN